MFVFQLDKEIQTERTVPLVCSRCAMMMFCPRICWVRGRFGAGLVLGDDGVDEFGIDENGDYYAYND